MSAHSGSESSAFNREIDRLISAAGFPHPPVGYRLFTWSEDVHFHISWMRATLSALDKPAHLVGTETRRVLFADEIGYREPYTYFGGVLDGLLSGFC